MKKLLVAVGLILAFTLVFFLVRNYMDKPITADEFEKILDEELPVFVDRNSIERLSNDQYYYGKMYFFSKEDPFGYFSYKIYDSEDEAKEFYKEAVDEQEDINKNKPWIKHYTGKSSDDYERIMFEGEASEGIGWRRNFIRIRNTVLIGYDRGDSSMSSSVIYTIANRLGYPME